MSILPFADLEWKCVRDEDEGELPAECAAPQDRGVRTASVRAQCATAGMGSTSRDPLRWLSGNAPSRLFSHERKVLLFVGDLHVPANRLLAVPHQL